MLPSVLLVLFLVPQDVPKPPLLTLAPPTAVMKVGARVKIGAYFRNEGTEPLKFTIPRQIDAEIVTPRSRMFIALTYGAEPTSENTLAPGESQFVEYELELPPEVSGRVVLEVKRFSPATTVIDIEQTDATEKAEEKPDSKAVSPTPEVFSYAETALQRFHPYEPMYVLWGGDRPNIRFQFSFKYQIFNPEGPLASETPFWGGLFLGYTQTGLWDLEGPSTPFTDSNYMPELAWSKEKVEWMEVPGVKQVGLQYGFQHESNGQEGDESRSLNIVYVKPVLHFGDPKSFSMQAAPKVYLYAGQGSNNSDIEDYRGYCDMKLTASWEKGFQAAALGRLGSGGDNGSIQFDLTYPLRKLSNGNVDMFLQLQWFSGYGESLITYDEYTDALRIGVGLVR